MMKVRIHSIHVHVLLSVYCVFIVESVDKAKSESEGGGGGGGVVSPKKLKDKKRKKEKSDKETTEAKV